MVISEVKIVHHPGDESDLFSIDISPRYYIEIEILGKQVEIFVWDDEKNLSEEKDFKLGAVYSAKESE